MTRLNPKARHIHYPLTTALICAAATTSSAANFVWRGTSDNHVWDTTSLNWASDSSTSSRKAWVNDSASSGSNPRFDSQGAKDIEVTADGVQGMELDIYGGDHTLSGGPVTVNVVDTDGGNLTIYNHLDCTATSSGWGFRMFGGNGTFTVGDGGYLDAYFSPFNGDYAGKLIVLTNGTFRVTFNTANLNNSNKPTIYFNGGTLLHTHSSTTKVELKSPKLILGAGGMHIAERAANGWTYLPYPIGTDNDLPTDGGLITDNLTGYLFLQNYANTFRGGLHVAGTGGAVGVEANQTLGQTPASPEDNIFFECPSNTVSSKLVSHGSVTLNANRNIRIGNGVTAQLGGYNSSSRLTVKGAISCENPEHGFLATVPFDSRSPGPVTLDPGANRTNRISRLFVGTPTVIASGTTLLESSKPINNTASAERFHDNDGSPLHVRSGGTLTVSGGEVITTGTGSAALYATQSGTLVVSGGLVDLKERELLNAYTAAATTTVKTGGRLHVGSIRMSGNGAGGDASKSVLNLETGGVVRVTGDIFIHENLSGYKATVNCNGGTLEWANGGSTHNCPVNANGGNRYSNSSSGLSWNVKEGGLVVSNDVVCYFRPALISDAASDGGVTKWGNSTFALFNTGSTFNGPVTIMQGYFRLGNPGVIPATGTARVNAGAYFYLNQQPQTLARIEGSGTIGEVLKNGTKLLSVTSAIAPGMGADSLGTLTISGGGINIADNTALEIDVDENGNSDCLSYPDSLDLSKLRLVINDGTKLDRNHTYTILTVAQGMSLENEFASVSGLPETWHVKYNANSVELHYTSPFMLIVR